MSKLIIFYICFLNLFSNYGILSRVKYVLYIFLSIACTIYIIKNMKRINFEKKSLIGIAIIFMIMTIPSTIIMIGFRGTNELTSSYIRLWLLIPIIFYVYSNININKLLKMFIRYSIVINGISLIKLINKSDSFGRVQGIFSHPNFYAFYLIIIILYLVLCIKYKEKGLLTYLYVIFNIIMILAAGSKTALIALSVSFIYIFSRYIKRKNIFLRFPIIGIMILIILIIIVLFGKELSDLRVFDINYGIQESQVNSFEWRLLNWQSKITYLKSNFWGSLFGLGVGSEVLYGFKGYSMHNEYLRILFENGIIGCILIIIFLKSLFRKVKNLKDIQLKEFYIAILIVMLVGSMSENIFVAVETLLLYLSLIFSINLVSRVNEAKDE